VFEKLLFRLKPANVSIIRPINGTVMNIRQVEVDLSFIAVGFNQRILNDQLLALAKKQSIHYFLYFEHL
jgi:hypothetical protein